jgi:hypothetical protein
VNAESDLARALGGTLPDDEERLPIDFDPPPFRGAAATFAHAVEVWLRELPVFGRVVAVLWLPVEILKEWLIYGLGRQDDLRLGFRVEGLIGAFLFAITTPAVIYVVVTRMRTGAPARFGDALRWGWRRGAQTFRSRLLANLAMLGGLILLVVPGIMVGVWFSLLGPVVAIEGPAQNRVLTRSRELVRGRGWLVLRLALLIGAAFVILTIATGILLAVYDRWWVSALAGFVADLSLMLFDIGFVLAYLGIVGRQPPAATGPPPVAASDPGGPAGG